MHKQLLTYTDTDTDTDSDAEFIEHTCSYELNVWIQSIEENN